MPALSQRKAEGQAFPVVGVGASAGGLEAFTELVQNLPADTGMAFVLIQHLRHDADSLLAEILGRASSMPVIEASDGLQIESNHIYVMPAAADLEIFHGKLLLVPRAPAHARHLPIDHFFASLAEDAQERAIGVILSGAGNDGTAGVRAIKSEGGLTFVQDPQQAAQDDMPRHAIESGAADFVLEAREIAGELSRLGSHPYLVEPAKTAETPDVESREDLLRQVFLILRRSTGMDFSGYKRATFGRRLARRMLVRKVENLEDYVRVLKEDPEEVQALYQDVLIMVTEFFRDPETFDYLRSAVFPRLVEGKELGDALRVWVVGCSSGQEVYSFAIALLEYLGDTPSFAVQIFGTDINERDIETARVGFYPASVASEVSPERLRRFFTHTSGGYRIKQSVRDRCTFAKHDLTRDPPFSRLDLISCRNVLIYFDTVLQERVVPIFHYALVPDGVLVLGRSETIGTRSNLFQLLDKKHHVYARRPVPAQLPMLLDRSGALRPLNLSAPHVPKQADRPLDSHDVQREADEVLARAYAPASVVVDEGYRVISFRGSTGAYLEHPSGRASLDLLQMAREGLGYELRSALQEAKETVAAVRRTDVRLRSDDARRSIEVEVTPFRSSDGRVYFVISFREAEKDKAKPTAKARKLTTGPPATETDLLRLELEASREHLQSVMTEKDVGTEELRAAYEEIQSSNEELQSTNEELETAKEELQSINEELSTVNDELVARNLELSRANDDLANLMASVSIPVIMVDRNLRLRRFTPGSEGLLHVVPSDIGRLVTEIKLKAEVADLEAFLHEAIDSLRPVVREVKDATGRWHSMRALPYKTAQDRVEGAVLSFIDVDELKRSLEQVAESKKLSDALNEINAAINSTFEFDEIMRRIMERAGTALGSQTAAILVARDSRWMVRHVQGLPKELVGTYFADAEMPQAALARTTRRPVAIAEARKDERVTPAFRAQFDTQSELVVPLMVKDVVLGVLLIDHVGQEAPFTPAEVSFATKLGTGVSLALENARLYGEIRAAERLNAVLSDVIAEVAATRDIIKSLEGILEQSASALGADTALCSFRGRGGWQIGHVVGLDPELVGQSWGAKEARAFPSAGASMHLSVASDASDKRVDGPFLKKHHIASVFLVPLFVAEDLAGLLLFGFSAPRGVTSDAEEDFMAKLSSSVSLGIENNRRFDAEHRLAESLRKRLSPRLPTLPGLELGAGLHMAVETEKVGGDFYEVFSLGGDRAVFLVGDVMGKGLAAAELTDIIRASAKAVALIDPSPSLVLDTVDRVVRQREGEARAATGLVARLDMKTGALEIAGAGHPPGVLCADVCSLIEHPFAPPLGCAAGPYGSQAHLLGVGETLILHTDGLIEARRGDELFGEERLLEAVARMRELSAQALAEALINEASEFAGGELKDDVAVLVVRRTGMKPPGA